MKTKIEIQSELDEIESTINTLHIKMKMLNDKLSKLGTNIDDCFNKYEQYSMFKDHLEKLYGPINICGEEYSHSFVLRCVETEKYQIMFEQFRNNYNIEDTETYKYLISEIQQEIHFTESEITNLEIIKEESFQKLNEITNSI